MDEDRKSDRKRRRFAARLKDSKGINIMETPGPNIVLCNVGQATGFEKQNIIDLIKEHFLNIEPPKFIAEKGESHSFLTFPTTESAMSFYKVCNGKPQADASRAPLYMSYVERVPDTEILCPHKEPKGLTILNNFITENEEKTYLDIFDFTTEIESNLKNRQVKHYGYEFRYGTNDVDLNNPLEEKIPDVCDILWKRLEEYGFQLGVPDQLTVNKYVPGQGIPSHVDRHSPFGSTILSLSLGSPVVMEWRHHSGKLVPVVVPARSMLVMQDEARYDWQHGIQPRTHDPIIEIRTSNGLSQKVITSDTSARQTRISLTFRWTRRGPCQCVFKTLCDVGSKELDDKVAEDLEELHVHQVYEQIASHFSSTRHTAWPGVVQFLKTAMTGDLVVDLGAGNGKNILHRNDILQMACERSAGLVSECARSTRGSVARAADCLRLDMLYAPLRSNSADKVICIAVIHHFTTKTRRLRALSTIHSILRPSRQALITVWAKDQTRSNYLKHEHTTENERRTVAGVSLPVHENRTQFQHQDLLVPWKLRKKLDDKLENKSESTLLRYYHVFDEGELDSLCEEVGFVIETSFYEEGNWCVVCKKL